jgi:hypothetical protein
VCAAYLRKCAFLEAYKRPIDLFFVFSQAAFNLGIDYDGRVKSVSLHESVASQALNVTLLLNCLQIWHWMQFHNMLAMWVVDPIKFDLLITREENS